MPSSSSLRGPWGGLFAILFATLLFSIFCPLTFVLARRFGTYDYRSFFKRLLGPAWPLFELAYLLFVVLILAVYGAAAGAIGAAVFGAPEWVGTVVLMAGIAAVVAFGNKAVERLFRDVSYYLYGIYAVFIVLALWKFGGRFRAASHNIRKPPAGRSPALRISATTSSARLSSCRCSATSPATATRLPRG